MFTTGNQKVMGSIPVSDSEVEVFSSEKKEFGSIRTFLLYLPVLFNLLFISFGNDLRLVLQRISVKMANFNKVLCLGLQVFNAVLVCSNIGFNQLVFLYKILNTGKISSIVIR